MSTKLKSGHIAVHLEGDELAQQERDFGGYTEGLVRLQPGGWFLPTPFLKYADDIYSYKFRPTDVVVMTCPKSGTTWTQEIVWTMTNNINFDHPMANTSIEMRSMFLELDMLLETKRMPPVDENNSFVQGFLEVCPGKDYTKGMSLQMADVCPDPRIIKTHLPFSLLTRDLLDTCKVIYVVRNPYDICVSYYHHSRIIIGHDYKGSFDQFVDYFVNDELVYSPFLPHIKEALDRKGHKNLHFVHFEDMKEDPFGEIKKLDAFIGTGLSDELLRKVVDYTSFSAMKERNGDDAEIDYMNAEVVKKEGGFFRKGEAGDWKAKLTQDQELKIRSWMESGLKGLDLEFRHGRRN